MILGIGTDIIEIERVAKTIERMGQLFLDRLFTHKEQEYCLRYQGSTPRFAGRFAAKEAISKALGTGIGDKLSWHDIEILNGAEGRPYVILSAKAKKQFGDVEVQVSISHNHSNAIAFAVVTNPPAR